MKIAHKLIIIALLWLILFNPGSATSIDTNRRMQMAHAWWTGTEEGLPEDTLIIKVDGKNYVPYDLGQSMLILPGDWLGTKLGQQLNLTDEELPKFVETFVSFIIFIPIALFAVLSCFSLLKLLGYSEKLAGLSSLVWLLGTSVLFYAGFHQQNTQILLCVTIGYSTALAYTKRYRQGMAIASGLALGIAYSIRITSVLHTVGVIIFLLGCLGLKNRSIPDSIKALSLWMVGFIPLALCERFLTYYRYGSWKATSISLHLQTFSKRDSVNPGEVVQASNDNLQFLKLLTKIKPDALFAPLISPEKSIFLYDPLLLPSLILLFICWRRFSGQIKWYLIAVVVDFVLHLYIYSWTSDWIMQEDWGARYHLTSIQLLMIPLIPLLVRGATAKVKNVAWLPMICSLVARIVIILAILVMFSSHILPSNLELAQQKLGIGSRFRVFQRINNVFLVWNYEKEPSVQISEVLKYTPDLSVDRKISWDLFPFRMRNKLNPDSSLQKLVPVLFVLWSCLFILAITMTIWFCKTLTPVI